MNTPETRYLVVDRLRHIRSSAGDIFLFIQTLDRATEKHVTGTLCGPAMARLWVGG